MRCKGVVTAEQYVMIEYNIPRAKLSEVSSASGCFDYLGPL